MADGERHQERLAELNQRLAAALNAMDFELALACQIEIDDLRRQRKTLTSSRTHLYLMQQAAASPRAVITKHSRKSKPVGHVMFSDPTPVRS